MKKGSLVYKEKLKSFCLFKAFLLIFDQYAKIKSVKINTGDSTMVSILNKWLNHSNYFRVGFIIILIANIFTLRLMQYHQSDLDILFIICAIFLGIGFYHLPSWLITVITFFIVFCQFFLVSEKSFHIAAFLTHFVTYLLIVFISVSLMKNIQKVNETDLELTTALAKAIDSRDPYTLHHSESVAKFAVRIAEKMNLPKDTCNIVFVGSLLHDIGKIGIPEHILNKPGALTDKEYKIIKSHTVIGHRIIHHVVNYEAHGIADIVLYHHERYDGKGYPYGLKGNQIPLEAQIVTLADSFDAITSNRIYKDGVDLNTALNEIRKNKGTQFNPEVVDAFLRLYEDSETENNSSLIVN